MNPRTALLRALPGALLIMAGCTGPVTPAEDDDKVADAPDAGRKPTKCEHPFPCKKDWPKGLEGPFVLSEVLHVQVPSHDGVLLEGWIGLPALPAGVKAPIVLHSTPYLGTFHDNFLATPGNAEWWNEDPTGSGMGFRAWRVPPIELVHSGYATAFFSVRGTGGSGGCFDYLGHAEQQDQSALVGWLAAQPWSNGRVAMGGVSYPAATAWEAAVAQAPALKTIVTGGIVSDLYTLDFTPQGALRGDSYAGATQYAIDVSLVPPIGEAWNTSTAPPESPEEGGARLNLFLDRLERSATGHVERLPARLCDSARSAITESTAGFATEQRNAAWYGERRQIDRYGQVTAAVLLAQGLLEGPHAFQDDAVWKALERAPKRRMTGQWGHTFPLDVPFDRAWASQTWSAMLIAWFDYWLKGIGSPARLGSADYQANDGMWRSSDAWPPADAREEVLYLAGASLATAPVATDRAFHSAPTPLNVYGATEGSPLRPWAALCGTAPSEPAGGLAYLGEPLAAGARLAGNPFAYLRLSSDQPGGLVEVSVVELASTFACDPFGQPSGVRLITYGAADLRFHGGNFTAIDFPVGEPRNVRVDLIDTAAAIEPGSRIAVVVSHDGSYVPYVMTRGWFPAITVHGGTDSTASHVVLPLVEGSTGGHAPTLAYPSRPFVPASPGEES